MTDAARPKRKYDSRRRQAQAAATRRSILDASQRLFERDGYVATTMEAIASEAGVALKTVYGAFTTKSGILRSLWDLLLKGDVDDAPVAERPWYREMLDEPEPERQLRLNARNARIVKSRIGPLLRVIRGAADVDPDSGALWRLIQSDFYDNQHTLVDAIDERNGLRPDLDPTRATDILWTLNHPDVWLLLVGERGWTPEEFESWFADTTCQLLLGEAGLGRGSSGYAAVMARTTWKQHTIRGELTSKKREDLPASAFAFPKQRKEPLVDASHVRNALARFDQVEDVSDKDRDVAFANIKRAAKHYGVTVSEKSWKELGRPD